ncbi:unnamed protein product [Rotaria sordida]|uniref:Integrase catalytic domain-containing protein n=2 Tax=Rotaria sordida TaxID=392033 RepID=A0A815WR81_9BILA|nr:unnamed protein product [Rotaria sordida]
MQIDLIDMRTVEHNGFKWIFHAKDHFSKYSWLYPLVTKEAINVAETLKSIFYQFGPPRILQSDNGREFVAKVILALTKLWPGLLIINGRPRHPQSQGLVERGNAVVQQLLGKWLDENVTTDWPSGLGPVMYAINISVARTINQTPFEVVFEQQPRTDDYTWKCIETHLKTNQPIEPSHVILEEDLPDDIFDMIKQVDEIEGPPIDPQTNNSNEEPTCTNVASTTNTNDQQPQNNKEEIRSDFNIDHEELVDSTTCLSNVLESKAASIAVNRHKRIRENTEECYLNNAHSQLTKYISKSSKRQRTYHVGDIIGLKVSDVDRTNTSSTILPCKIVDSKDQDGEVFYNVATMNGIIKESFQSIVFLDITASNFTALRILNIDSLSSISFIQACQIYTNFKSADTCKCNGSCSTNRCQCKKKDRKCCSKCHGGNSFKCKNC